MRKLSLLTLCFVVLISAEEGYAQFNRSEIKRSNKRMGSYRGAKSKFGKEKVYQTLGFSVNALNYYGDLAPTPKKISTDISFTRPGFGISYSRRMGPRFTMQGQFMFATISGSDNESADKGDLSNGAFRYKRNLSFRNQIKELSVVAIFDLFENQATYMSRAKWTPYVYFGLAGFLHNPQAKAPATDLQGNALAENGKWVDLRPLGTEGQYSKLDPTDVNYGIKPYSLLQVSVPFGWPPPMPTAPRHSAARASPRRGDSLRRQVRLSRPQRPANRHAARRLGRVARAPRRRPPSRSTNACDSCRFLRQTGQLAWTIRTCRLSTLTHTAQSAILVGSCHAPPGGRDKPANKRIAD